MIGELINKFDNLESNTLADFNSIFRSTIKGGISDEVVIGDLLGGQRREVKVNGERFEVELRPKEGLKKGMTTINRYQISKDGVIVATFNFKTEAADFVGGSTSTVFRMVSSDKECNGYTADLLTERISIVEKNRLSKPRNVTTQSKAYIISKDGIEMCFRRVMDICIHIDTYEVKVLASIKNGESVNGYTIKRRSLTKSEKARIKELSTK